MSFRVLALWVFVEFAASLSTLAGAIIGILTVASGERQLSEAWVMIVFGGLPTLIYLALGTILWINADRIAVSVYGDRTDDDFGGKFNCSGEDVLAVAFVAMGIYIVVTALPQLFRRLAGLFVGGAPINEIWGNLHWQIEFWAIVVQLLLGLWLAIGMRGIARALRLLQRRDADFDGDGESKADT